MIVTVPPALTLTIAPTSACTVPVCTKVTFAAPTAAEPLDPATPPAMPGRPVVSVAVTDTSPAEFTVEVPVTEASVGLVIVSIRTEAPGRRSERPRRPRPGRRSCRRCRR